MALTLTAADLRELQRLTEDMRHKDAAILITWLNEKLAAQSRATVAASKPEEPALRDTTPHVNGADAAGAH